MSGNFPKQLLQLDKVGFQYRAATEPTLHEFTFAADAGDILLLAGRSGGGKSTLLRCINGLIPRSYRGELRGTVHIAEQPAERLSLAKIGQLVGTLLQDPDKQIVASYVAEEVAFGLENLRWPRAKIVAAVDAALDELGIGHLKGRETFALSGGEKQKVALAGLIAMGPQILLLDEPLASLDPLAAEMTLSVIRAQADQGRCILMAEHRIEDALRVQPTQALVVQEGHQHYFGDCDGLLQRADPMTMKLPAPIAVQRLQTESVSQPPPPLAQTAGEAIISFERVEFWYNEDAPVLKDVSLDIRKGDVIALLGPNGSGKSTLVKHAIGLNKPRRGRVLVEGNDTREVTTAQLARTVGYVFQSPTESFAEYLAQKSNHQSVA